ncbi:MAG: hypothetical protein J2P36_39250, partial [Ktedonobacteraceae bacterium]|nr:hypothetical protein [Ktedonobacteraceae bacterium]
MWIVVDIDGTICGVNAGQIFGAFHCQDLGLTIAPEMFATVASYADLVQLPPVRAFWRDHQEEWAASRRRAVLAPAVLAALAPLPGAVEGLRQLTTIGSLCYLSARSPQVHAVTLAWLERHGFPQYDRLCCVDSIREKIQFLARSCPPSEPCVVIDDRGHTSF